MRPAAPAGFRFSAWASTCASRAPSSSAGSPSSGVLGERRASETRCHLHAKGGAWFPWGLSQLQARRDYASLAFQRDGIAYGHARSTATAGPEQTWITRATADDK